MNIWIFNHYAITPDLAGGTRHYDFARKLVERGHKVTIFASSFHYLLKKDLKFEKDDKKIYVKESLDGIDFIWIKTPSYKINNWKRILNMLVYSYRAYKKGKRCKNSPDIIIGSSVHLFAVLAGFFVSKKKKAHFLMEVRDLWPQTLVDMGISKYHPFVLLLSLIERFSYKKAEKIIVLLPNAKEYIVKLGVTERKIEWIPNGVFIERFKNINVKKKASDKFIILYMGAMSTANNLGFILETAEILKKEENIEFWFVGDGTEKELLRKISKEKDLKNVIFKDPVSKSKVYNLFGEVDCLLFPLQNSPVFNYGISSNKLFDYLYSQKPVIFSGYSINNPVEEAKAGISIPPNDPKALAKAILKIKDLSEEEREKMGLNGRRYVEKYHNIEGLAKKLEKILKEVVYGNKESN